MTLEHERGFSNPRVILITGAANGMGRETVEALASNSQVHIIATDINPSIHERFPVEQYPRVSSVELDVRSRESCHRLVDQIVGEWGRVDGLVNVAGIINRGRRETYWQGESLSPLAMDMLATNLGGPLFLMEAILPYMRDRGEGLIVNVTTTKYANPDSFSTVYEDSKGCCQLQLKIYED